MSSRRSRTPLVGCKIFSGSANPQLAKDIASHMGLSLGKIDIGRFSDGEVRVEIEERVRGETIFLIQPTHSPVNDTLMELLAMVDAFKRSAVKQVIAVMPYYGYARQDRRPDYTRTPITSRLVADLLEVAGVDQMITVDLHSTQQQGFFKIPTINVSAKPVIIGDVFRTYGFQNPMVVSPDTGGVVRARAIAKEINNADLAIIDKRRPKANVSQVMNIIGDVSGRTCIIIDDMIDTAGTLCKAANALKDQGAEQIICYATHGVLSGNAFKNFEESGIDEVVITDTIPIGILQKDPFTGDSLIVPDKVRVISIAQLLGETLRRIHLQESVSEIYVL